ncbi:hypothetical protein [Streptomyces sp. NPDC051132]|uniref:hypothetical protein n=1 Tax=unclassified Streptomyces TaxID=2593676 RepID=UPI00343C27D6
MVRIVLRGVALGAAAVWWWALLRLAAGQGSGMLEGAVVAGGWGISLLPVHCVPKTRATGAVAAGRWEDAWQTGAVTRASGTGGTPGRS